MSGLAIEREQDGTIWKVSGDTFALFRDPIDGEWTLHVGDWMFGFWADVDHNVRCEEYPPGYVQRLTVEFGLGADAMTRHFLARGGMRRADEYDVTLPATVNLGEEMDLPDPVNHPDTAYDNETGRTVACGRYRITSISPHPSGHPAYVRCSIEEVLSPTAEC